MSYTGLAGRVALVTGGARNIGLAIAERFVAEGARVVLVARSEDEGETAAAHVRESGGEAMFVRADVSDPAQVSAAVDRAVETFGGLNFLVNNAAVMGHGAYAAPLADLTVEHWQHYVSVNLTGPFLATKYAVPAILATGSGAIVNVSSLAAYSARPIGGGYGVLKAALGALTRYTAVDYASHIRCNELVLGSIEKDTPIYATIGEDPELAAQMQRINHLGRLGQPTDVANACVFLCSEESAYVTGAQLRVDGGAHITSPMPDYRRIREVLGEQRTW